MSERYTPIGKIVEVHECARRAFESHKAAPVAFRKAQIAQIGYLIKDNEKRLIEALQFDLGRPALETELYDMGPAIKDVRLAYDSVGSWARPQRAFSMRYFLMGPQLTAEPKGVVLIISPFNLPIFLTLSPLASAIAAGCAAVIKPSEATPHINKVLAELLPKYVDPDLYHIVQGGIPETTKATQILELRWDHILYIGGERVARIVTQAAARHLTPVTLELGGKNPLVVDPRVDPVFTAKRILWGRFGNAGQICTAPEYVLVPEEFQEQLISALKDVYHSFYPDGPEKSDSFARIVSAQHAARIKALLDQTGGDIVCGGEVDVDKRYVAPTIVNNVTATDSLMSEEIFGPVLAVIPVKDVEEAISVIRSRQTPLAVYVFSPDKRFQKKVFSNTKSGAALANETTLSPAVPGFPVGGVGASGYGYYAGRHAFEQFTHWRVSLDNPIWFMLGFRFPPYKAGYKKYLMWLYPPLPPRPRKTAAGHAVQDSLGWSFWIVCVLVGASAALLTRSLLSSEV
ncbi:aldehyde dehydrogenase [Lentinus brumalis]|uniref:Aldehyde dehydrogenase n=1 Tax=Lentinus brumalis TaxID=2498619 RepID=A0A371CQ49_9APHY|nr:aldehyde dehydrogenase [Polyporus brumalis]